jgi:beta-xylosidase
MTDKQKNQWATDLVEADAPFWLINKCVHRMETGVEKYGEYNRVTDKRNLFIEIEKELLDAINYLLMQHCGDREFLDSLVKLTVKAREMR